MAHPGVNYYTMAGHYCSQLIPRHLWRPRQPLPNIYLASLLNYAVVTPSVGLFYFNSGVLYPTLPSYTIGLGWLQQFIYDNSSMFVSDVDLLLFSFQCFSFCFRPVVFLFLVQKVQLKTKKQEKLNLSQLVQLGLQWILENISNFKYFRKSSIKFIFVLL